MAGSEAQTTSSQEAQGRQAAAERSTGGFSTAAANSSPGANVIPARIRADGQSFTYDVSSFFSDADGDDLTFTIVSLPSGLAYDGETGLIFGNIDRNASQGGQNNNGIYTITVTASDGNGGTVEQSFDLTVTNPAPIAANDTVSTDEDQSVTFNPITGVGTESLAAGADSDPDGDALSITASSAGNGTVIVNGDGSITYTPNANYSGTDTIIYTVTDGNEGESTATVQVTVNAVNDAPTSKPIPDQYDSDAQSIDYDAGLYFNDVDKDSLTFTADGLPPGLSIDPAGRITGALEADASTNSPYTVTITATDGIHTETREIKWFVTNLPPQAFHNTFTVDANANESDGGNVLDNDRDPDNDALTIDQVEGLAENIGQAVAGSNGGTFNVDPTGNYTFDPGTDFKDLPVGDSRTTSITYRVTDGVNVDTATITVTVLGVNDAPTAGTIPNYTRAEGQSLTDHPLHIGAFFQDIDANDVLTFSQTGLPAGLSMAADGTITGTIASDASQGGSNGAYTVMVTADDRNGGRLTETFTFTVTNPAPTAADDTVATDEDQSVTFNPLTGIGTDSGAAGADSDPDNDPLTIYVIDGQDIAVGSTVEVLGGSVTLNDASGSLTFTPTADFNGAASFVYRLTDSYGGFADAQVTINVAPVNDTPVAQADAVSVDANVEATFNVLDNDSDVDGDVLTVVQVNSQLDRVGLQVNGSNGGVFVIEANGEATFDPRMDFAMLREGQTRTTSAIYQVSDGHGGVSNATVTVTVTGVNDAPVTTPIADRTSNDADVVNLNISTYFSDPDLGDSITFTATGLPPGLVISSAGVISGTMSSDASVNGPYEVSVTATDTAGASAFRTFTWSVTNPSPVAKDDDLATTENATATGSVFTDNGNGADSDPNGDAISISAVNGNPALVGAAAAGSAGGTFTIMADGSYTFAPGTAFDNLAVGQSRTTSVTYTVSDGQGGTSTATVTMTVTGQNDAPVTVSNIAPQVANNSQSFSLDIRGFFADVDSDALTYAASGLPGGLTINSAGEISGTVDHDASEVNGGVYTVNVTARDPSGQEAVQTFTLTVGDSVPVAGDDQATTREDTPVTIPVLANDADPAGGVLVITAASAVNGAVTTNSDGTLTYVPAGNFHGADIITYTIQSTNGGTAIGRVAVTVTPVNDAPRGESRVITLQEDGIHAFSAADFGFSDPHDTPSDRFAAVIIVAVPNAGTLTLAGVAVSAGQEIAAADLGRLLFTPAADAFGTAYASLSFVVRDDGGTMGSGLDTDPTPRTLTFDVAPVNDAPVAGTDRFTVMAGGGPVELDLLSNDTDVDSSVLFLTAIAGTPVVIGQSVTVTGGTATLVAPGRIQFVPLADFTGNLSFAYTLADGDGATATGLVMGTVGAATPEKAPPTAVNDSFALDRRDLLTVIDVLANDDDADGGGLRVTEIDGQRIIAGTSVEVRGGSVTLDDDGNLIFVRSLVFGGTTSFSYGLTDDVGHTAQATVTGLVDTAPQWLDLGTYAEALFARHGASAPSNLNTLIATTAVLSPGAFTSLDPAVIGTILGYRTGVAGHLLSDDVVISNDLVGRTLAALKLSSAPSPALLADDGAGGWASTIHQSVIIQSVSNGGQHVSVMTAGGGMELASPASGWSKAFALQSLQADFSSDLIQAYDQRGQGSIVQANLAEGAGISLTIDGNAASPADLPLSNGAGLAVFETDGAGAVEVARPVMLATTLNDADDQTVLVRMRQSGVKDLSVLFYRVDDYLGTIDGLRPGEAGYAEASAARAYESTSGGTWIAGRGFGAYGESSISGVDSGDLIAMLLSDGTHRFFGFSGANEQINGVSVAHLWSYGYNTFGWEDTYGGGDRDYNDLVVQLDFATPVYPEL